MLASFFIPLLVVIIVVLAVCSILMLIFLCVSIDQQYKIVKGIRYFKDMVSDLFRRDTLTSR